MSENKHIHLKKTEKITTVLLNLFTVVRLSAWWIEAGNNKKPILVTKYNLLRKSLKKIVVLTNSMINGLRELEIEIELSGIRKRDRQLDLAEKK